MVFPQIRDILRWRRGNENKEKRTKKKKEKRYNDLEKKDTTDRD